MKKYMKLTAVLVLALCLTGQAGLSAVAAPEVEPVSALVQPQISEPSVPSGYNDYDSIVNTGINTSVPQTLAVANPSQNFTTTAGSYYITGTSNPSYKLYMNDQEVTGRGIYGSFGVNVALALGANTFTFTQGDSSKSITITRVASASQLPVATTNRMSSLRPSVQDIARPGEKYTLRCTAPSGASVYAVINGERVDLKQAAATAVTGVAATFSGTYTLPNTSQVMDLGAIQYIMYYNGNTSSANSAGSVYVAPEGSNVVVQVNQSVALSYVSNNTSSDFSATMKQGATDYVSDVSSYVAGQSEDMFKISTGWIPKQCVKVLPTIKNCYNKVSDISYERSDKSERIILSGTAQSMYKAVDTDTALTITLYNTSGIDSLPMKASTIFSGATVTEGNNSVQLTFNKRNASSLWGYTVDYSGNDTILYFKTRPTLASNSSQPLKGITIALDAGHGGNDSGAAGTAGLSGPTEKDLTLAAVKATQKRLESLGATVIVPRTDDSTMTMDYRIQMADAEKVDFFISMHYNSIATGSNADNAKGIEVYYYNDSAINFGQHMLNSLSTGTGRNSRGVKFSTFRVTVNTSAPALLLELGFLCNPIEYDNICSPQNLYQTANAVAEGIISTLK